MDLNANFVRGDRLEHLLAGSMKRSLKQSQVVFADNPLRSTGRVPQQILAETAPSRGANYQFSPPFTTQSVDAKFHWRIKKGWLPRETSLKILALQLLDTLWPVD